MKVYIKLQTKKLEMEEVVQKKKFEMEEAVQMKKFEIEATKAKTRAKKGGAHLHVGGGGDHEGGPEQGVPEEKAMVREEAKRIYRA